MSPQGLDFVGLVSQAVCHYFPYISVFNTTLGVSIASTQLPRSVPDSQAVYPSLTPRRAFGELQSPPQRRQVLILGSSARYSHHDGRRR